MSARICENCTFFQPNGGALKMGYCIANKWTYRKPDQTCDKFEKANFYVFTYIEPGGDGELFGGDRQVCVKGGTLLEAQEWFDKHFPNVGTVVINVE